MDGTPFGRYVLTEMIGSGGMGEVWRAHDAMLRRDVAIKILPAKFAAAAGYRERFQREAYVAAGLNNPNIIPIHEAGEIDGRLYLVMPVVGGVDVHTMLERDGPLSPQAAVRVIEQAAAALEVAHSAGLVHRDVKPSNLLMVDGDFVYLTDFGIAAPTAEPRLTDPGMIVGTFAYMAPERFIDGNSDARSDVYSLACALYECLTGQQPFGSTGGPKRYGRRPTDTDPIAPGLSAGTDSMVPAPEAGEPPPDTDDMAQQIAGHLTLPPPRPSEHRPDIPAGFDEVIANGMAKKTRRALSDRARVGRRCARGVVTCACSTAVRERGTVRALSIARRTRPRWHGHGLPGS